MYLMSLEETKQLNELLLKHPGAERVYDPDGSFYISINGVGAIHPMSFIDIMKGDEDERTR